MGHHRTNRNQRSNPAALLALLTAAMIAGCYSVQDSQRFFREAAARDPALELLHQTALYNVFYDHALRRCVLHSSHTWGERGGGGGGTGLGITAFACDPARIKARVHQLRFRVEDLRDPSNKPAPRQLPPPRESAPAGSDGPSPSLAPPPGTTPAPTSYDGEVP